MAAQLRGNLTKKMEDGAGKVHFRRWKAMSIGARISLIMLITIVLIACFANFIAPHDPLAIYTARQAPDGEFLFGTDDKGRDVLSRMMYGARYSLTIGLGATAFALVCGSIIGSLAAVSRKWISEVIMRILDIIMSFPGIALAAVFVAVFGNDRIGRIVPGQRDLLRGRCPEIRMPDQLGEGYVHARYCESKQQI